MAAEAETGARARAHAEAADLKPRAEERSVVLRRRGRRERAGLRRGRRRGASAASGDGRGDFARGPSSWTARGAERERRGGAAVARRGPRRGNGGGGGGSARAGGFAGTALKTALKKSRLSLRRFGCVEVSDSESTASAATLKACGRARVRATRHGFWDIGTSAGAMATTTAACRGVTPARVTAPGRSTSRRGAPRAARRLAKAASAADDDARAAVDHCSGCPKGETCPCPKAVRRHQRKLREQQAPVSASSTASVSPVSYTHSDAADEG